MHQILATHSTGMPRANNATKLEKQQQAKLSFHLQFSTSQTFTVHASDRLSHTSAHTPITVAFASTVVQMGGRPRSRLHLFS